MNISINGYHNSISPKVKQEGNKRQNSFKGALNNPLLLKSLEAVSNHPATFVASATLFMSAVFRPLAIALTPKTKKENKKYAIADSISSGVVKFAINEAIALPIENAINYINKNPEKFLNKAAINSMKESGKNLLDSRNYKFAQQLVKNTPSLLTAFPKSVIGVALIPVFMNKLFPEKKNKERKNTVYDVQNKYNPTFAPFYKDNSVSFKGFQELTVKGVSKIFNAGSFRNLVNKYGKNDTNIARNMSLLTDVVLAASSVISTKKSKKIKEENKNPLIYNKIITTGVSVLGGWKIDELIQKSTKSFINKFKQANINDPKLDKYIQGINVVRPTLVFALLYYGIFPIFSTFAADRIDRAKNKRDEK